jgi:cell wall-associated NlpC family hydrolase
MNDIVSYLEKFLGTGYELGGEINPQDGGVDCSGFILEGLRAFGLWGMSDDTAQGIFNKFKSNQVQKIDRGCLLFFGKSIKEITHISIARNDWQMLESGGNDKTGMVRFRPIKWRSDLVAIIKL